jgi:hypothetical protein
MTYLLRGRLHGELPAGTREPIADAAVRFYWVEAETPTVDADAGVFSLLTPDQLRAKELRWIGQARTDDCGEFSIDLAGWSVLGVAGDFAYSGEPVEVDVYCRTPRNLVGAADASEVQFTAARVQPDWIGDEGIFTADVDLPISHPDWRAVRTAIDAWAITGRVIRQASGAPIAGARVSAFDADLVLDDSLGTAITDSMGRFQIEFRSIAFRGSRHREMEIERSGPDLYFRVDTDDGRLLIAEDRSMGNEPSRRNAGNLVSIDLFVDG